MVQSGFDFVNLLLELRVVGLSQSVRFEVVSSAFSHVAAVGSALKARHPRVVQHFLNRRSFGLVLREALLHKVQTVLTNAAEGGSAVVGVFFYNLSGDFTVFVCIERLAARQQNIGDNAQRPNVDLLSVRLLLQDFRRHKSNGSERVARGLRGAQELRKPEVE